MNALAEQQAEIQGVRLAYREAGDGSPVICLHSGVPAATAKADFASNIDSLSSGHRVVLVDLPSFGGSGVAPGQDEAAVVAGLLVELLAHLRIERADVIGNGLGGEVALHIAAAAPETVGRLVLIAPTGCRYSIFTPAPMEGIKAIQSYWEAPSEERMAGVLRLLSASVEVHAEAEVKRRHEEATRNPETAKLRSNAENEFRDVLPLAPHVKAPTLLIWGREDRFVPLDHGLSLLKRIPDARFHMLPNAGHCAQLDQPGEVNALVRDFLRGPKWR